MNPRILLALKCLDYRSLVEESHSPATPVEAYVLVRAAIILGRREEAKNRLENYSAMLGKPDGFLYRFLVQQIEESEGFDPESTRTQLLLLKTCLPPDSYLQGEYHLLFGYFLNEHDGYRQGTRHHRLAADCYAQAGLQACEAIALFNLCVSYEHVNEKQAFSQAFARLSRLAEASDSKLVKFFWLRLNMYRQRSQEDFQGALEGVSRLMEMAVELGRLRDLGGLACHKTYLLLKLARGDEVEGLIESLSQYQGSFHPEMTRVLAEYRKVAQIGLVTFLEAKRISLRWKRLGLEGIHYVGLLSVLMDLLLKSREYEAVARFARQVAQISIRTQQGCCLVDFRYYEILSKIRLGELARAKLLLKMYEDDARNDKSEARLSKARELRLEIEASGMAVELSVRSAFKAVVLNLNSHTLTVDSQFQSLARKPMVEKLLSNLIRQPKPRSLAQVFRELYGIEFHPLLHERRFNSLIDRTRASLGDSSLLLRRDGKVGLSPGVKPSIEGAGAELEVSKRRELVKLAILQSPRPLSISDLEGRFDYSRRTLQLDLHYLAKARAIDCMGTTRARKYFASSVDRTA